MEKIKSFFIEYKALFKSNTKHMIFTIIVALILGAILFGGGNNDSATKNSASGNNSNNSAIVSGGETTDNLSAKEETIKKYPDGMYKIGSDMPAGEYVIISDYSCYVELCSDSAGTLDSIITNENFTNRYYITVKDGQYLDFSEGYAIAVSDATAAEPDNGIFPDGMYKVGLDLAAGEYKIRATSGMGYYAVYKKGANTLDDIVSNDLFESDKYITISDGQYILLSDAELIVG